MDTINAVGGVVQNLFWLVGIVAAAAVAWERVKTTQSRESERIDRLERDVANLWSTVNEIRAAVSKVNTGVAVLLERTKHMEK